MGGILSLYQILHHHDNHNSYHFRKCFGKYNNRIDGRNDRLAQAYDNGQIHIELTLTVGYIINGEGAILHAFAILHYQITILSSGATYIPSPDSMPYVSKNSEKLESTRLTRRLFGACWSDWASSARVS